MNAKVSLALGVLLIGMSTGLAFAQEGIKRTELKRVDLTGVDGKEITQAILVVQPGVTVPRHIHYGDEIAYVLEGAMVQMGDAEPTELKTGASLHFPREVPHGGAKVVGDTPLRLLTVHIVDKGQPLSQPAP